MKKAVVLSLALGVMFSSFTSNVLAHGGGSAGVPTLSSEQLMKYWNGQAGTQEALVNGVLLHWKTDACGTLNGQQFDADKCAMAIDVQADKETEQ
ncbi:hypothetical protein [Vibrio vulnificus]|uniref:hypothetical protein n=1 Tax=Vibrio vulnificus TaxID=672 RepID=UPI001029B8FB|nr:hypothetical protein [Vibrio vulnificus]EGR0128894.1 hypothetical protein [Vibrio vulnificus]MCU8153975.1 hypothetical protein [Vibrio vulnificus]RZP86198.1 hypothetical protein D8T56_20790 [Vibrio vulnificus]RZQ28337.1 hypothetical protein D8T42_17845 [Vibrio vulnificus]RZQ76325.1 hypothetical protein D8T31_17475 [Vibrio vulnificus]